MTMSDFGTTLTTANIEYFQAIGLEPASPVNAPLTMAAPDTRRLVRIAGTGRFDKRPDNRMRRSIEHDSDGHVTVRSADVLTGLFGHRIPMAFIVTGGPNGVDVSMGTWSKSDRSGEVAADQRMHVLTSLLQSLYPVVSSARAPIPVPAWPYAGVALGYPTAKEAGDNDDGNAIDRLIRSMGATSWAAVVLGFPVAEQAINDISHGLINELRAAEVAKKSGTASEPLMDFYIELMKRSLQTLSEAASTGGWRTSCYLLGDADSYPRLKGLWRGIFSGRESLPEPIRVFDRTEAAEWAMAWAMPDTPGQQGPGAYQRPLEYQTILTSAQLATYVQLPDREAPGFAIDLVPDFDAVVRDVTEGRRISLGTVLHSRQPTAATYSVSSASLARHAFVGGVTGAGKTNTILSFLLDAWANGVPFLVIEPAKTEYRALLESSLGTELRVFTAGDDSTSPFRLNPFEVPDGIAVSEHLDLLRAVFGASFGMWTPLPQVLEQCLHAIYADRGWDLRTNENIRAIDGVLDWTAFPTLSDLVEKVDEVVEGLGYEDKIKGDLKASLTTRLDSLRTGGKGAMLDVARSFAIDDLLARPAVLELEAMGNEDDKAFFMGLLLIRLTEYVRTQGHATDLRHLLVIEEAHRLLANVSTKTSDEQADPRGQAVEAFSNILSEIRVYGEGVVIADQVPVRLAPDVLKNTNLKIAHRIVANDDRDALAGTMAMTDAQARALAVLAPGEAAVFAEGDDSPMLVRIPQVKGVELGPPPTDKVVADAMARWTSQPDVQALLTPAPFCALTCSDAPDACSWSRRMILDEEVQRVFSFVVLSVIEDPEALDRRWIDIVNVLRRRRPSRLNEDTVLRAFAGHGSQWYANRRGTQRGWTFVDTDSFASRLRALLLARIDGNVTAEQASDWTTAVERLFARDFPPYTACYRICTQDPPMCLYRDAVADLVATGKYDERWRKADTEDLADGSRASVLRVVQDAAWELIEFPDDFSSEDQRVRISEADRRVSLCFAQQMAAADDRLMPREEEFVIDSIIDGVMSTGDGDAEIDVKEAEDEP